MYGDPLVHPQPESYFGNVNCIGERSCYDEGKRVAETLTFDYYREHGLEVSICQHVRLCRLTRLGESECRDVNYLGLVDSCDRHTMR